MSTLPGSHTSDVAAILGDLVEHQGPTSISLILPTHRTGRQVEQNAIRFKNLVKQALKRLITGGMDQGDAERLLQPVFSREHDADFWQHQSAGLALYHSEGEQISVALRESPDELVYISDHYYVLPVAIEDANRQAAYVLAVSWERASLYHADRDHLDSVDTDLFPVALRDVVLPPDPEEHLQFRTQRQQAGGTMFHGQGEGEEVIESDRLRFLSEVGKRFIDVVGNRPGMMIVVATDEVAGHLTRVTDLKPDRTVKASPDGLNDQQLRQRVLEAIRSDAGSDDSGQAAERLATALAHGKASEDLQEILQAARSGRVATLLVDPDRRVWGERDPDSGDVTVLKNSPENSIRGCELINWAVLQTLRTGGSLAARGQSSREQSPVAAMFRY